MIRARCHKTMRRAARARVFSSESWTRQYKRARGGWQYYVLMALAVLFIPFFVLLVLITLPAMAGVAVATGRGGTSELVSVVAALLSVVVALGHAGWLVRELVSSRSLAVVSQLPVSDERFFALRARYSLLATLAFLVVGISFFVAAAIASRAGIGNGVMIAGLGLLQWCLVVSVSLIVPAWFPRVLRAEAISGFVSLGVMAVVASVTLAQMNVIQLEPVRQIALIILPTGWVFLLLEFGILDGIAVTWWLLVPCLLTLTLGVRAWFRLKARYRPREILLDSEHFARVTFEMPDADSSEADIADTEPEFELDPIDDAPQTWQIRTVTFFRDWIGIAPKQEEVELSRGDATDLVRSRDFLEPYSWPQGGLVERMVGSILTEREQRVAELMCCSEPEWSRRMLMDMGLGCLGLSLLLLMHQIFGMRVLMMSWHVGLFVLFAGLRRSWPGLVLRCSTGHMASLMGILPITHRELNRAVMVLGTVRALAYAPFALAVSVAGVAGMRGGFDWVQAIYIASKAVLIIVAIHQWWFIGLQPHQSSKSVLAQIGEALLFIPIMILAVGGAGGMVAAGSSELWSMAGAALMFGAGWLAQRWQRKRVLHGPIDFITLRPGELQQQMQARQRKEPTETW